MPTLEDRIGLWNGVRPGEAWLAEDAHGRIIGVVGVHDGEVGVLHVDPDLLDEDGAGRLRRRRAAAGARRERAARGRALVDPAVDVPREPPQPRALRAPRLDARRRGAGDAARRRRGALPARVVDVGRGHRPRGRALPPARRRRAGREDRDRLARGARLGGRARQRGAAAGRDRRARIAVRPRRRRPLRGLRLPPRGRGRAGRRDALGAGGRRRAAARPAPLHRRAQARRRAPPRRRADRPRSGAQQFREHMGFWTIRQGLALPSRRWSA